MDQTSATAAADSLAQRYSDRTGGEAQRSRDVAFHLAYELLPDDAITACVLLGEENEPTLVALDGQQLYLLTVPRPGEVPAATGKLRTIRVAPDTGTAEVDATSRGFGEYPPQKATWRFKLDGVSIELQIKRDAEGRTTSDWPLAKALAEALGWKISQGEPLTVTR